MSAGGIFSLIINTGMQDQILLATELLNKRLREIRRLRCKNPSVKDKTPTLVDIEKTHILFMNAHFKPMCAVCFEYQSLGAIIGSTRPNFGNTSTFSIPQFGDFFADMVLHIRLENLLPGPNSSQVKYCDYLGHRLLKLTQFEVNGNVLDQYDSDLYNFHYNFFIHQSRKDDAWKRCVGQEIANLGFLTQNPLIDNFREQKYILNGPQTPQTSKPILDMWIPLMFWFNVDPRLCIPSVSIPYGQRFIKITFAKAEEICQGLPGLDFIAPSITVSDLWINNIFVNPEIHDIFIKRIGFQLIRVHRYQQFNLEKSTDQLLLNQLKWPIETIYLGVRPADNEGTMEDWWKFHIVTENNTPYPVASINPAPPPNNLITVGNMTWKTAKPVLSTFAIEAHGIKLYVDTPIGFYNFYIPYKSSLNICSPIDIGVYMVVFNFYPGAYQPSGHINLSSTREFFLIYQSSILSTTFNATLVLYGVAINFLLIAEGTAALRYNT